MDDMSAADAGAADVGSSVLVLDHVGDVALTLNSDTLSWEPLHADAHHNDGSDCLGFKLVPKVETQINFADAYAVELIGWGVIHESRRLLGLQYEMMYRFTVHGIQRSKAQPSLRVPAVYTFGHKSLRTCQMWVNQIDLFLSKQVCRPKNLLVFVHPLSGKGNGCKTWETVAPIFSRAKVKTKVLVTQWAGHAFDVASSLTDAELNEYDGLVAVGGDGLFNEILNGLLGLRHFPYPPTPSDSVLTAEDDQAAVGTSGKDEACCPLLPTSTGNGSGPLNPGNISVMGNL
uniref:DAGKc domain-containing protein n=1 Tax=Kalanchoe fedtschenkoi TaxID=63787 RepID=A0A7N1A4H4_KALFE